MALRKHLTVDTVGLLRQQVSSHGSLYLNGRINCKDAKWPFENTTERINMTKG